MMSCPICATETGRAVRQALADQSLGPGLVAIAGPFVVLSVLIWALSRFLAVRSELQADEP